MRLRAAVESDVPAMLAVYAPYVRETTISFEYEAPSLEEFTRRFRSVTGSYPWICCEIGGRLAGYAYAGPRFSRAAYQWDADLSIYLSPEFQGRGVGKHLCAAVCALLQMQGYHTLYAVITAENTRSLAFHSAMGFVEIGRFPASGFKFGRWLDVVWMERKLGECGPPSPPLCFSELPGDAVQTVLLHLEALPGGTLQSGNPCR